MNKKQKPKSGNYKLIIMGIVWANKQATSHVTIICRIFIGKALASLVRLAKF